MDAPEAKPLIGIGSTHRDMQRMPEPVQDDMGYALYVAQIGGKHCNAKPLSGFGGDGVLEVVADLEIFEGSGNGFADLGLPNPEERLLKA